MFIVSSCLKWIFGLNYCELIDSGYKHNSVPFQAQGKMDAFENMGIPFHPNVIR